jgi:hypothetical protein
LNDDRLQIIRDYSKSWDSLSDETAKDLGNRALKFQEERVKLRRKYFDRIAKVITPSISAKFFQIENQLEDLLDLEVASALPLVK